MDLKELDKLAKKSAPMPKNLLSYEQSYYIAARGLYEQYKDGKITLVQAREEKKEVMKAYEEGKWEWHYFMGLHEVLDKLKQLKEVGFDTVMEQEVIETIERVLNQ